MKTIKKKKSCDRNNWHQSQVFQYTQRGRRIARPTPDLGAVFYFSYIKSFYSDLSLAKAVSIRSHQMNLNI